MSGKECVYIPEQIYLQRYDFRVVYLRHIVIGEGVAGLIVDLEACVKLEHVQQLRMRDKQVSHISKVYSNQLNQIGAKCHYFAASNTLRSVVN